MCSKYVEAWNKLVVKQKFCASSWLITEINILRCTVSKMSKFEFSLLYYVNVVAQQPHGQLHRQRRVITTTHIQLQLWWWWWWFWQWWQKLSKLLPFIWCPTSVSAKTPTLRGFLWFFSVLPRQISSQSTTTSHHFLSTTILPLNCTYSEPLPPRLYTKQAHKIQGYSKWLSRF